MTSTTGNRTYGMHNDVKLGHSGSQTGTTTKQPNKKSGNTKRGGAKRRMASLAYHQQHMLSRGGYRGGRPLHPARTNAAQRMVPSRYTNVSGPSHLFPPQKFGFFNEATPSIHPGHPGSEKRIYEGPSKPRLMMEEQKRTRENLVGEQPHLLLTSGRGDFEPNGRPFMGSMLELGNNETARLNEQQSGMNELFAKMIWKKLDMIQSPMRLNRLHTEIMNLLQQAIAEETGSRN